VYQTSDCLSVLLNKVFTLEIRNNSKNGINVPDASLVHVTSKFDVMELMNVGLKNRAVGSTALNDRSSRSHRCILSALNFLYLVLFLSLVCSSL
jgi:Kinesin motor domain